MHGGHGQVEPQESSSWSLVAFTRKRVCWGLAVRLVGWRWLDTCPIYARQPRRHAHGKARYRRNREQAQIYKFEIKSATWVLVTSITNISDLWSCPATEHQTKHPDSHLLTRGLKRKQPSSYHY